jgi:hypothetical protein
MRFDTKLIVPPTETFNGLSYGNWVAIWWNWLFTNQKQGGSVYFLRGNTDLEPVIIRTGREALTISVQTAIFFPIICTINSVLTNYRTDNTVINRMSSAASQKDPLTLKVSIDRTNVTNLKKYYAESPEFIINVPLNSAIRNYFKPIVKSGRAPAVAAGYWILIKRLPVGKHVIYFEGKHQDGFKTSGTYEIMITK